MSGSSTAIFTLCPATRCTADRVGVLYGKTRFWKRCLLSGGRRYDQSVTFEKTIFNRLPYKFEAETPTSRRYRLGAAADYLSRSGWTGSRRTRPTAGVMERKDCRDCRACGWSVQPRKKASVLSFVLEGIHPHDIGTILDQEGIAIRTVTTARNP